MFSLVQAPSRSSSSAPACFLSVDIADVNVEENIGARLQGEQAEADKRVAQAKAEERRAMAVAAEQEMQAKVQEMRARVVEAEAEVPLAMAEAFRSGNLGIMDYVRYNNVRADTDMRSAIAKESAEPPEPFPAVAPRCGPGTSPPCYMIPPAIALKSWRAKALPSTRMSSLQTEPASNGQLEIS